MTTLADSYIELTVTRQLMNTPTRGLPNCWLVNLWNG